MKPKQTSLTSFFKSTIPSSLQSKKEKKFDEVPGLCLITNFITEAEEQFLWQGINKLPWIKDYRPRRYQTYGYSYSVDATGNPGFLGELPEFLGFLADRVKEHKLMPGRPNQCGVNEYEIGQGIAAHIDNLKYGEELVNVSMGSDIVMDFYGPEGQKKSILLPRRSLLLVEGVARNEWKHAIAYRKTDKLDDGTVLKRNKRISVTFRIVKEQNKYDINQASVAPEK